MRTAWKPVAGTLEFLEEGIRDGRKEDGGRSGAEDRVGPGGAKWPGGVEQWSRECPLMHSLNAVLPGSQERPIKAREG